MKPLARRWAIAALFLTPGRLGLGFALVAGLALALAYGQPRWLLRGFLQLRPGAMFFVAPEATPQAPTQAPTQAPMVALTLDDGPNGETTAALLDLLAEHQAQATFFVIGEKLPPNDGPDPGQGLGPGSLDPLLLRLVAEGHELGNHLYRDEASIALSPAAFEADLLATAQRLAPYGPFQAGLSQDPSPNPVQWLRPGRGWYSAEMLAIAQRHGYQVVLGDRFPYDTHLPFPRFATAQILGHPMLGQIQPGSIIVLHDGPGRGQRSVATLQRLLPVLQRRGYRVVTLSTLASSAPSNRSHRP